MGFAAAVAAAVTPAAAVVRSCLIAACMRTRRTEGDRDILLSLSDCTFALVVVGQTVWMVQLVPLTAGKFCFSS